MHIYELHLHELGFDPDRNLARDSFMATGPEPTILEPYRVYGQIFLQADSMFMATVPKTWLLSSMITSSCHRALSITCLRRS
jgi:hypothetical protein